MNLLERLLCYWTFFRLSVCLYFLRYRRKLLRKLLLLIVALIELFGRFDDRFRNFFRVHGCVGADGFGERVATPNGDESERRP